MNRGRINQAPLILVGLYFLLHWRIDGSFPDARQLAVLLICRDLRHAVGPPSGSLAILSIVLFLMFAGLIPSPSDPGTLCCHFFRPSVDVEAQALAVTFDCRRRIRLCGGGYGFPA